MTNLNDWLQQFGLGPWVIRALLGLSLALICILTHELARRVARSLVGRWAKKTRTQWDDILVRNHVFARLAHLAPGLVLYLLPELLFGEEVADFLRKVAVAYLAVVSMVAIDAFLNACVDIYRGADFSQGRPIKGLIQTLKIFVFVIGGIWVLATLMNASPWKFLSGIGALSAVLMLVFKDSILGLVASIQVALNHMVQIGDWIEMPKYGADGSVIDISLNTVKVQNWDKTITTIPTYALVSDPVKNWRGMSESGGRRIKRSVHIDMHTVKFCSDELLEKLSQLADLKDYLSARRSEVESYNKEHGIDTTQPVNGRRLTNLGCFRAYLLAHLRNHPLISKDLTLLVRQLAPGDKGLPIEIYVFCTDKRWAYYEDVQADLFDHLLASIPEFDLAVFQSPSGRDFRGVLTP